MINYFNLILFPIIYTPIDYKNCVSTIRIFIEKENESNDINAYLCVLVRITSKMIFSQFDT